MRALAVLLLALLLAPAPAAAQTPVQLPPAAERVAHDAMVQLRSPVTPSHTLDMCPAAEAVALRDTVRMAALAGMTTGEIVEDVVARYGEPMRILPKRSGVGLVAWLLTPLALIGGGIFVVLRLRAMRGHGPVPEEGRAASALTEDDRRALAAALHDFEADEAEAAR